VEWSRLKKREGRKKKRRPSRRHAKGSRARLLSTEDDPNRGRRTSRIPTWWSAPETAEAMRSAVRGHDSAYQHQMTQAAATGSGRRRRASKDTRTGAATRAGCDRTTSKMMRQGTKCPPAQHQDDPTTTRTETHLKAPTGVSNCWPIKEQTPARLACGTAETHRCGARGWERLRKQPLILSARTTLLDSSGRPSRGCDSAYQH